MITIYVFGSLNYLIKQLCNGVLHEDELLLKVIAHVRDELRVIKINAAPKLIAHEDS